MLNFTINIVLHFVILVFILFSLLFQKKLTTYFLVTNFAGAVLVKPISINVHNVRNNIISTMICSVDYNFIK